MMKLSHPRWSDHPTFEPVGTARELLELGVFGGHYFDDAPDDIPKHWTIAKCYYFGKRASKPRQWWLDRGLIDSRDPLGWFQWYLRFQHYGRRIPGYDDWQIKRHNAFKARHQAQLRRAGGDIFQQRGRRQALLHWACDAFH